MSVSGAVAFYWCRVCLVECPLETFTVALLPTLSTTTTATAAGAVAATTSDGSATLHIWDELGNKVQGIPAQQPTQHTA